MDKRLRSLTLLAIVLTGMLVLLTQVGKAEGGSPIYIRADGSVYPPLSPVQRNGDTYTLTSDINCDSDGIIIERNNTVIDGNGNMLHGNASGRGFVLWNVFNVTIKNTDIKGFYNGVYVNNTSYSIIAANNITESRRDGVYLANSYDNYIFENKVSANKRDGISLYNSSNNLIYHNNFANNTHQVQSNKSINAWDSGYPSCGNYWSDYVGQDMLSGPFQNKTGYDGVGDSQYLIDASNSDRYPLMHSYGSIRNLNTNLVYFTLESALSANETLDGHIIYMRSGFYHEHVWMNKSVSLIGENKQTTIIDGSRAGTVIQVTASNARISGLTIQNGKTGMSFFSNLNTIDGNSITNNHVGLELFNSNHNDIKGNNITIGYDGIVLFNSSNNNMSKNNIDFNVDGISLYSSSNYNNVDENGITNNLYGVSLYSSSNYNNVDKNSITKNTYGLKLDYSWYNSIKENNLTDNKNCITLRSSWYNGMTENNLTDNKNGAWLLNSSNNIVSKNSIINNEYGVVLDHSANIVSTNGIGKNDVGICVYSSWNSNISENSITDNYNGIELSSSSGNNISENNVTNNTNGILLDHSSNNVLRSNRILENKYNLGVYGWNLTDFINDVDTSNTVNGKPVYYWISRQDSLIPVDAGYVALVNCTRITVQNLTLAGNGQGILLIRTTNAIIRENNIVDNDDGIYVLHSLNNSVYHNNIVNNTRQVYTFNSTDTWDDGYPSGGNYWSHYSSADLKSGPYQNEIGGDGIGDTPYVIDPYDQDNYPLMGPFHTFYAGTWGGKEYNINVVSNSTFTSFTFDSTANPPTLRFNVTGINGTIGFCRVVIPMGLMWVDAPGQWFVTVGGTLYSNRTITDSGNYTCIYFTYTNSRHDVKIQSTHAVPEFQSLLILPLLMTATLLAGFFFKRKQNIKTRPSKLSSAFWVFWKL